MAKKKNFIFTNRRHSKKAIMSTVLGTISTVSLSAVILLAYRSEGIATRSYGLTGLFVAIFSVVGLLLGLLAAREKDRYNLFRILGIILNLLALSCISAILYLGVYM